MAFPVDVTTVQGDILSGLLKKLETTVFFQIGDDVQSFRKQLTQIIPLITTTPQAAERRAQVAKNKQEAAQQGRKADLLPIVGVTLAFSKFGLTKLGITDSTGDSPFEQGQLADAPSLADDVSNWLDVFKNGVHGVFIIAGDCQDNIDQQLTQIEGIFGVGTAQATINEVFRVTGNVRPDDQKGHEHFGFLDGISNPAVTDFDKTRFPGQESVPASVILFVEDETKPSWTVGGSFLAFRYLSQLVPEFNDFLKKNPIVLPGLSPEQGSEFLGARLVGRWKSGAPVDLAPLQDDPALGADPQRNNNFRYDIGDDFTSQDRCPFAAHVRKTNPRNDLEGMANPIPTTPQRIIRRGIPFGPEVSDAEAAQAKTLTDRGLLFRCYQSSISNGFRFIQTNWANNTGFPFGKPIPAPGFDAIIGQASDPTSRTLTGVNPQDQGTSLSLPTQWVVSKGGEYFFTPSTVALRDTFALPA